MHSRWCIYAGNSSINYRHVWDLCAWSLPFFFVTLSFGEWNSNGCASACLHPPLAIYFDGTLLTPGTRCAPWCNRDASHAQLFSTSCSLSLQIDKEWLEKPVCHWPFLSEQTGSNTPRAGSWDFGANIMVSSSSLAGQPGTVWLFWHNQEHAENSTPQPTSSCAIPCHACSLFQFSHEYKQKASRLKIEMQVTPASPPEVWMRPPSVWSMKDCPLHGVWRIDVLKYY